MLKIISRRMFVFVAITFSLCQTATSASAETQIGSSVESRVLLAFQVDNTAAQEWLPEGWKLLTLPKGPFAGANLLVSFIDRHLAKDANGRPEDPHASRAVATVAYGVKEGVKGVRTFITRVYETPPVDGAYANSIAAQIAHDSTLNGSANEPRLRTEVWSAKPQGGGEIRLSLSHQAGTPSWSASESKPHSSVNPDFYRIYRYQQLVELAMSEAVGKELNGTIEFQSTVPELADMFNGSEKLKAVLSVAVYVKDTFLP